MTIPVITAFALGVHLLVFLSLGLLVEGNEQVRRYRWFVGAVSLWLALLLLASLQVAPDVTATLSGGVAHFLPALFVVFGAVPLLPVSRAAVVGIIAAAVVLLPFTLDASPWHNDAVETAWFVLAWGAVSIAVSRALRAHLDGDMPARRRTVAIALVSGSLAIGLLVAVGAIAAIPLVSALLQAVVLYATVRLSLYEVRAGASRTTALAADASTHDRRAVAGEIAAMIAHEVRNPLTGVRSLAQRIAEDTVDDERRRRYASLIVREVDRVERMVGALLGASARRPGAGGATETPLRELFDDVSLLVTQRFGRTGVQLVVDATALAVAAPREPLAQVLLNLLLNAADQAPAGTRVRMGARPDGVRAVELLVEDRGPGVKDEDRDTIFTPFYSGTGGSGLGLAVVRRLCDEYGWGVRIDDTDGGGATFVVTLPAASVSAPSRADPSATRELSEARTE